MILPTVFLTAGFAMGMKPKCSHHINELWIFQRQFPTFPYPYNRRNSTMLEQLGLAIRTYHPCIDGAFRSHFPFSSYSLFLAITVIHGREG